MISACDAGEAFSNSKVFQLPDLISLQLLNYCRKISAGEPVGYVLLPLELCLDQAFCRYVWCRKGSILIHFR